MRDDSVEIYEPLGNFRYIDEAGKLQTLRADVERERDAAERVNGDGKRYIIYIVGTFDPAPLINCSDSLSAYNRLCRKPSLDNMNGFIDALQIDIERLFNQVEINNRV